MSCKCPKSSLSAVLVFLVSTLSPGQVIFEDDFESFLPGQKLVCQDSVNWDTWSSIPCDTTEDPFLTNTLAYSGSNSVWLQQNNDLLKPIPHYTSGKYSIRFQMFIPADYMASWGQLSGFYNPDSTEWGLYVKFDLSGNGSINAGGWSTAQFSFPYDTWLHNELIIDMNNDWAEYYFQDNLVYSWQWTLGSGGDTCSLQLAATDFMGSNWPSTGPSQWYMDDYVVEQLDPTGINELPALNDFKLEQNYPNPFNPVTYIEYQIIKKSPVTIKVYDVLGNEVGILVNEEKETGRYSIEFDASGLPSGVYIYQLKADGYVAIKKMILLK